MFFFTRKGYEQEIRRLQLAFNDLLERFNTSEEAHRRHIDSLFDRLMTITEPGSLRELRRDLRTPAQPPPDRLKEPTGRIRRAYHEPKSALRNPVKVDWTQPSPEDEAAVAKIMHASIEEGN